MSSRPCKVSTHKRNGKTVKAHSRKPRQAGYLTKRSKPHSGEMATRRALKAGKTISDPAERMRAQRK